MSNSDLMSRLNTVARLQTNRFNISCRRNFTANVGSLIPIYFRELCPGNHISFSLSNLTRTVPMMSANYGRMRENFDVFFVPWRLLNHSIQSMLSGTQYRDNNGVPSPPNPYVPFTSLGSIRAAVNSSNYSDAAGIPLNVSSMRLLNSLGYGVYVKTPSGQGQVLVSPKGYSYNSQASNNSYPANSYDQENGFQFDTDLKVSILPLLAYQKIYQDYFRNKFWEREDVSTYQKGGGYVGNLEPKIVELRYSDFDKDRIFGMVPDENNVFSLGATAINLSSTPSNTSLGTQGPIDGDVSVPFNSLLGSFEVSGSSHRTLSQILDKLSVVNEKGADLNLAASAALRSISAMNIKRLNAMQRFSQIVALNKDDYKHQMSALFGTKIPDLNSDYSVYLGGKTQNVVISEVAQTSEGDSDPSNGQLGYLAGRGTVFGKSNNIDFTANEHGYIMVIYHLQPQVDFLSNFIDPQLERFSRFDFMIPQFADLGFEPVRLSALLSPLNYTNGTSSKYTFNPHTVLGYLPRYWSYKTDVDVSFNGFADSQSLGVSNYLIRFDPTHFINLSKQAPTSQSTTFKLDYRFFKVFPSVVDPLFYVRNDGTFLTDEFMINCDINAVVDLPLSVDSLI